MGDVGLTVLREESPNSDTAEWDTVSRAVTGCGLFPDSAIKGHSIARPTLSTIDLHFAGNTELASRFETDSWRSKLRRACPIRAGRRNWCASLDPETSPGSASCRIGRSPCSSLTL